MKLIKIIKSVRLKLDEISNIIIIKQANALRFKLFDIYIQYYHNKRYMLFCMISYFYWYTIKILTIYKYTIYIRYLNLYLLSGLYNIY